MFTADARRAQKEWLHLRKYHVEFCQALEARRSVAPDLLPIFRAVIQPRRYAA
jgi:hypothetical protein